MQSPSAKNPPSSSSPSSSSHSTLPNLAAPKAISKRALNLEAAAYTPPSQYQISSPYSRSLPNSSGPDFNESVGLPGVGESPTRKVLSPAGGAQAKLDAQHALAEVTLGTSGMEGNNDRSEEGSIILPDENNMSNRESNGESSSERVEDSISATSSSMNSLESTKAIASAHGIPLSNHMSSQDYLNYRINNPGRGASLPSLNGNIVFGPDGQIFRARSPATGSPMMENVSLSESPPKTRSFIGMPPRSGYELSDDPDDVGSEDGSTGSGRESIGTNEDQENEDDEEDIEEDQEQQRAQSDERGREEGEDGNVEQSPSEGVRIIRPAAAPRRPSLTQSAIVAPIPSIAPMIKAVDYQGGESMLWNGNDDQPKVRQRTDLSLTRNDGLDEDEEDLEAGEMDESQEEQGEDGQRNPFGEEEAAEESLSTLERIFLFAKSEMAYHRVLVSHSLADWILEVELSDAVEFVIPLLNGLACDENDVCTAFAPHLHRVMWHFLRNCPLVEDDEFAIRTQSQHTADSEGQKQEENELEKATRPKLSVAVFTPLLCALLLNSDAAIAGATQSSIVHFFARLQGVSFLDADQTEDENLPEEEKQKEQQQQFSSGRAQSKESFDMDTALIRDAAAREDKRVLLEEYDFGDGPRKMIMDELLHQVALAIGNLNVEQTSQIRELNSQQDHESQQVSSQELSGDAGGDAVMDDISLSAAPSEESSQGSLEQLDVQKGRLESQERPLEFEDTEMSLDMLEEGQESGDVAIAATTASLDNVSMTMSDVEEEVAVGRMASISLLAALGAEELVARNFLVENIVPEMIRFASDHTFFVRKEVAVSMGALAKCIGFEIIKRMDFLTIFENFCKDRIWHVRQAACLSLPNLFAQVYDREVKRSKVVEIMRIFVGDVSRNVRVAALDIIGELIYLFHEDVDGVPPELVRHFLGESFDSKTEEGEQQMGSNADAATNSSPTGFDSLSEASQDGLADFGFGWGGLPRSISSNNANGPSGWGSDGYSAPSYKNAYNNNNNHMDPDRPLVMAYNFPAVILTLGKSHWSKLKAVHSQLCSNPSSKVRRSLAASLHEVAKIIGVEWATEDLFEVFRNFLDSRFEKDEDVKMAMLQNIDVFMEQLTLAKGLESLKFLLNLWNEESEGDPSRFSSNWRLRERVISLIPNMAKRYLLEDDEGVLVVLMQSAIVDTVSSVRLQGIKIVSSLYHIFEEHDQVLADGFLGMLVDVGENESYRGRVACLQCLAELCKSSLQRSSVEMLMMNRLVELSKDGVVDVRIALAQLVSLMCSLDELYALPKSRSEDFIALLRRLSHDEAGLVQEVILSNLSIEDPGREAPINSPRPIREPRQLILGPADGSDHRPAPSQSSFDMNGDATGEVQSFEMDEEDDGRRDASQPMGNPFAVKDGSPSLENSTLMKRRFMNRSYHRPQLNSDADSSMFEDADDDEDEDVDEDDDEENQKRQEEQIRRNAFGSSELDEEEMITIPSQDNFLMLSTEAARGSHSPDINYIGDDSLEGDDESPHHLLGIASGNDSPLRQTVKRTLDGSPDQDRRLSPHGLSLESPERPWNLKSSEGDDAVVTQALKDSSILSPSSSSPALAFKNGSSTKTHDPFLAFVADKRFDQGGVDPEADPSHILSSPAGGHVKDLAEE